MATRHLNTEVGIGWMLEAVERTIHDPSVWIHPDDAAVIDLDVELFGYTVAWVGATAVRRRKRNPDYPFPVDVWARNAKGDRLPISFRFVLTLSRDHTPYWSWCYSGTAVGFEDESHRHAATQDVDDMMFAHAQALLAPLHDLLTDVCAAQGDTYRPTVRRYRWQS